MTLSTPARRLAVAAAALAIAAYLLRAQLADALVVRGDAMLYAARPSDALEFYRRALWFDPHDAAAVDRELFVATMTRDRAALDAAVAAAGTFLRFDPSNATVRLDRALAYRRLGMQRAALADFAAAGEARHDAVALTFAGFTAREVGERRGAVRYWKRALALDPGFLPARHGLARIGADR